MPESAEKTKTAAAPTEHTTTRNENNNTQSGASVGAEASGGENDSVQLARTTSYVQDQFVAAGTTGREFVAAHVASNIADIIEEEEEEENDADELRSRLDPKESDKTGSAEDSKAAEDLSEGNKMGVVLNKQLSVVSEEEERVAAVVVVRDR